MSSSAEPARLMGIPLGDFGFFSSILLSLASGFMAFFASCFLAIVSFLIWKGVSHQPVNFADTYLYVALPVGLLVMVLAFVFFTGTWLKRKLTGPR